MASLRSALIVTVFLALFCQIARSDTEFDDWSDEDNKDEDKVKDHDAVGAGAAVAAAAVAPEPEAENPPMAAAQQSGGNYASYNESCVQPNQNGKQCISSRGLVCTGGMCTCGSNPDNTNIPLTYISNPNVQRCEPLAHARNRYICSWDQQCRAGKYGYFSQCSNGRCACYDTDGRGRPTMEHENTCFLVKNVGDACEDDLQCNVTIPGEAICFGSRSVGICQCSNGYFEYEWPKGSGKQRECLETRTINQTCIADAQCRHNDALGPLARCHDGQCACYDTENVFQKRNVSYYIPIPNPNKLKGKCYFLKGANETCTSSEECILGYHSLAACLPHASYNGEYVCQCSQQDERKCNSGSTLFGSFVLVMALTLALVKFGLTR